MNDPFDWINLKKDICCVCGTVFFMDPQLRTQRLHDNESFYCPNGHKQHFSNEEESAQEKIKQLERRLEYRETTLRKTRHSARALKAVITKKNKVIEKMKENSAN